ncbi:5'-nucleotidase C-terminal domain-containing protein [Treponema primitia]|uniref:5'-nucleotidase C-terminal domain-containing protein n=1 Tax=Treponema primitia TaxID=88058 RepID=UPI00025553AA|nr:5'-nucleotidase C-terminal domain-containing protein [Treponema primitia]
MRNKRLGFVFLLGVLLFTGCENDLMNNDDTGAIPRPAPDEVSVIVGNGQLEIRWTKVATAIGYELYYNTADDPDTAQRWYLIEVNESRLVRAVITPLVNGTPYHVWVKVNYPHGQSEYSERGSGIPLPPPYWPDPISPVIAAGDEELGVRWPEAMDASGYELYYSINPVPPAETLSALSPDKDHGLISVTGVTEMIIPGLQNARPYYLFVRAVNSAGHSTFSVPASASPVGATAVPAAPVLTLIGGDKRLTLSWKAVQWAKSYKVYYSLEAAMPAEPVSDTAMELTITGQDVRAVISSTIENEKTYHAWVIAVNTIGDSPASQMSSAETRPKPPLDQDNVSFVIGTAAERFINEEANNGDRLSRKKETALGDMLCDSCTWYVREVLGEPIDFVYQNGGLITGALSKGTVTVGDIKAIIYPGDSLTILTMKGSAVLELFEFASKVSHGGGGGSGTGAWGMVSKEIRYTLDYTGRENNDAELKNLRFNGEPIEANRDYRIGINNYMYTGGDGYWMFQVNGANVKQTNRTMASVLVDYIYAQDLPLVPKTDGRVALIGGAVQ